MSYVQCALENPGERESTEIIAKVLRLFGSQRMKSFNFHPSTIQIIPPFRFKDDDAPSTLKKFPSVPTDIQKEEFPSNGFEFFPQRRSEPPEPFTKMASKYNEV